MSEPTNLPDFKFLLTFILLSYISGVSQGLISKIVKEGHAAEETGTKIRTPGKERKRKSGFVHVDDFDMGVIRRKVHEFYSAKKEVPTVKKLLEVLKTEINYTGQRESLRKLLHKVGFRFKKSQSNRKVLMERNEISAWRAKYLHAVDKNNKSPQPRPLIYLDETYIHSSHTSGKCWQGEGEDGVLEPVSKGQRYIIVHAGGDTGFVTNALLVFKSNTKSGDYHDEMNSTNFKKWVIEKLVPNLREPSIIVMDNAPYHRICVNKVPNTNSLKKDMQLWLTQNKIDYGENLTKPQLLEIIKRNKPEKILEDNRHKCLYLPPYHCDLNPIELIWSTMKRKVADVNIEHKNAEIPRLVREAFDAITVHEWAQHCKHVRRLEGEYLKHDLYLDKPFIIEVVSDTETESDSDNDDSGTDISGVWPHNQDEVVYAGSSKDHNYCKPGFQ